MIHVCSLARLYSTIDETGAHHIVTLLKAMDRVKRPAHIEEANHLILSMDDVVDEIRARKQRSGVLLSTEQILDDRDADRR